VTADPAGIYKTECYELALNLKNITDKKHYTSAHGSADILILPGPPRELQLPPARQVLISAALQSSSSERSIQAVWSCTVQRAVSMSAVGSSPASSATGMNSRAMRETVS
jgi:hypothetical protein